MGTNDCSILDEGSSYFWPVTFLPPLIRKLFLIKRGYTFSWYFMYCTLFPGTLCTVHFFLVLYVLYKLLVSFFIQTPRKYG
jgi:hypothetical protein